MINYNLNFLIFFFVKINFFNNFFRLKFNKKINLFYIKKLNTKFFIYVRIFKIHYLFKKLLIKSIKFSKILESPNYIGIFFKFKYRRHIINKRRRRPRPRFLNLNKIRRKPTLKQILLFKKKIRTTSKYCSSEYFYKKSMGVTYGFFRRCRDVLKLKKFIFFDKNKDFIKKINFIYFILKIRYKRNSRKRRKWRKRYWIKKYLVKKKKIGRLLIKYVKKKKLISIFKKLFKKKLKKLKKKLNFKRIARKKYIFLKKKKNLFFKKFKFKKIKALTFKKFAPEEKRMAQFIKIFRAYKVRKKIKKFRRHIKFKNKFILKKKINYKLKMFIKFRYRKLFKNLKILLYFFNKYLNNLNFINFIWNFFLLVAKKKYLIKKKHFEYTKISLLRKEHLKKYLFLKRYKNCVNIFLTNYRGGVIFNINTISILGDKVRMSKDDRHINIKVYKILFENLKEKRVKYIYKLFYISRAERKRRITKWLVTSMVKYLLKRRIKISNISRKLNFSHGLRFKEFKISRKKRKKRRRRKLRRLR